VKVPYRKADTLAKSPENLFSVSQGFSQHVKNAREVTEEEVTGPPNIEN
jgi:hypothetical protein